MKNLAYLLLIALTLAGCSDPTTVPNPANPTNPPQPNDGACANTWNRYITAPTTLSNTPSVCDYLLEGSVRIESTLTIEPGVVIRAAQDAKITVDGGAILAVGTAQNRIVLEGLTPVAGYWEGVRFFEGRESRFDYVDIKDAGQPCGSSAYCPEGGVIMRDVTYSFTNSTVSNSYVQGFNLGGTVTNFANNRFYGNARAGLEVSVSGVTALDEASDYSGGNEPNGEPYVLVTGGGLTEDSNYEWRWRKLNAPYLLRGKKNDAIDMFGGTAVFEPGAHIVFEENVKLRFREDTMVRAIGTAAEPVIFTGKEARPGYWVGLELWGTDFYGNEFDHVQVVFAGAGDGTILDNDSGIYLKDNARLKLSNTRISHTEGYAVNCETYSNFNTVELGAGNSFTENRWQGVSDTCVVTP